MATLTVLAADPAGNEEVAGGVTVSWLVDSLHATSTLDVPASVRRGFTTLHAWNVTATCNDGSVGSGGCQFWLVLDGNPATAPLAPVPWLGNTDVLVTTPTEGVHSLDVSSLDAAGNAEPPVRLSWVVDNTPPALAVHLWVRPEGDALVHQADTLAGATVTTANVFATPAASQSLANVTVATATEPSTAVGLPTPATTAAFAIA